MENIRRISSDYEINKSRGGFFCIANGTKKGIMDAEGRVLIAPAYDEVIISPNEGKVEAFICYKMETGWATPTRTFYLADTKGHFFAKQMLGTCIGVHEGYVTVERGGSVECYKIDGGYLNRLFRTGAWELKETPTGSIMSCGMMRISNEEGTKHYFVDVNGDKQTGFFNKAEDFRDGRAVVVKAGRYLDFIVKYGTISPDGKWSLWPTFEYIGNYHRCRAIFRKKGKLGFLSKSGVTTVPPIWDKLNDYGSEGTAFARQECPACAYMIDGKGAQLLQLPMDCEWATEFSEDMLPAKRGFYWGYIGRDGRWAIEPQFIEAWDFSGGVAPVRKGGEYFFINPKGERVLTVNDRLRINEKGLAYTDKEIFVYRAD